jgi:hypothetical protein
MANGRWQYSGKKTADDRPYYKRWDAVASAWWYLFYTDSSLTSALSAAECFDASSNCTGCRAIVYQHSGFLGDSYTFSSGACSAWLDGLSTWTNGFKVNEVSSLTVVGTGCELIMATEKGGGGITYAFAAGSHDHPHGLFPWGIGNDNIESVKFCGYTHGEEGTNPIPNPDPNPNPNP